jgi:hypothetical protein
MPGCSWASASMRLPILPAAPLTAIFIARPLLV